MGSLNCLYADMTFLLQSVGNVFHREYSWLQENVVHCVLLFAEILLWV